MVLFPLYSWYFFPPQPKNVVFRETHSRFLHKIFHSGLVVSMIKGRVKRAIKGRQ